MRVITGSSKGRKLITPDNYDIRPTSDCVKEAVFSIIGTDIEGRRVLDLFAGTGQLGIEALSRGAKEAVFIDESNISTKIIKKNLELCGFSAKVFQTDALKFLENADDFDIIFMDPPYNSDLYQPILDRIALIDILSTNGIIIVETDIKRSLPDLKTPYKKLKEYKYGKSKIVTYTKVLLN